MNKILFFTSACFIALSMNMSAQVGTNDASFNPGTGANAGVIATATQSDGKVIIGGGFLSVNGTAKNRIARLNADGTVDAGYLSSTGCNNTIYDIGILSSGKALAVGQFISYAGATANRIVRINTNGSRDGSFASGSGSNGYIYSFAEQTDGKIIILGAFTSYNGTYRYRIARLASTGALDPTFNPGTGFNTVAYSAAVQPDGKILAGGIFTTFNGSAAARLVRLTSTGALDGTFVTGTGITGTGTNTAVYSIIVQPDGKILVGGLFSTYNGTAKPHLIRLNANGTLDPTFITGTGPNAYVRSMALQPDGKIIVAGAFTSYNGTPKNRIMRLNPDGTVDIAFNGTGANGTINNVELLSTNNLTIGGDFTTYSGDSRVRIARVLNACPTLTTSLTGQTNNLCNGGATGSATVAAAGGTTFTYTWLPTGGNAASANGLSAGTYSVIAQNECLNSGTITVTISEPSLISLMAGASSTVCNGSAATLTANATGGAGSFTYNWVPGNLSGNTQTVNPVADTDYTVTATDANGCTATANQNVSVYTLPTISISGGTTNICSGSTATLIASGATTYNWSNGDNTATTIVNPSSTTTYTVTGTDGNGCSNTASKTVTVTGSCAVSTVPCGITLPNLSTTANAANVTGAVNYRFKFYNNVTNALIATKVQASRTIAFNTVPGIYYGNTYKWTVAVDKGTGFGVESNNSCTITFANPQSTVPCGAAYSNFNAYTVAQPIAGAINYRFTFYNNATNALVAVKTQTSNYIYFNQVPGLAYGNTYKWTVEVNFYNGSTTLYGPASSSLCTVAFNAPQQTVPCGNTYAQNAYTAVSAVTGATGFRYNFYDAVTNALVATKTNTNQYIYFNQVPGLIFNKTYNWTVEVRYNNGSGNVFGPASTNSCIINYGTPSSFVFNGNSTGEFIDEANSARHAQQIISGDNTDFRISAFPNPVKDKVNVMSSETIKDIKVYTISGDLMTVPVNANEIDLNALKTGIYIISVQTENNLKHLRVIKE